MDLQPLELTYYIILDMSDFGDKNSKTRYIDIEYCSYSIVDILHDWVLS